MLNKLKLKALLYKYTGIFLAEKEQEAYLKSRSAKNKISKIASVRKNKLSKTMAEGLVTGLWQANNGFARPMSSLCRFRHPRWFWRPVNAIATFLLVIKWDICRLFKK